MEIKIIAKDIQPYIRSHSLEKKWKKSLALFRENPKHTSLKVEILEPKHRGIWSFRIDLKYRALFLVRKNTVFIFQITNHYKK